MTVRQVLRAQAIDEAVALDGIAALLRLAGRDPVTDEGVHDTPARYLRDWKEMACSMEDPARILATGFTSDHADSMIVVGPMPFASLCEHHLLPFTGVATFGYIPDGHIVGLSKIPRLLHHHARTPQVQERLTHQVLDSFVEHVTCVGAGITITGNHLCAQLRGVRTPAPMTTTALHGVMRTEAETRAEFLASVHHDPR
jgi:GTP cyclohydrolase I